MKTKYCSKKKNRFIHFLQMIFFWSKFHFHLYRTLWLSIISFPSSSSSSWSFHHHQYHHHSVHFFSSVWSKHYIIIILDSLRFHSHILFWFSSFSSTKLVKKIKTKITNKRKVCMVFIFIFWLKILKNLGLCFCCVGEGNCFYNEIKCCCCCW